MKKFLKIFIPIVLVMAIILCTVWYLFIYDRAFTRDMLLSFARYSEGQGNHTVATWFYNSAYSHAGDDDAVAIELAEQYKASGNYTKAEYTLSNAIADGGGIDLYVALCKTYVEQDKLLDAVNMLNGITNEQIKAQLEQVRPAPPIVAPDPGFYRQYISVSVQAETGTLYVSADGEYPSTVEDAYTQPITLVDGENNIYAVAVAENGLVSPVAIFGYTVGGVVELMEFADPAIEAQIRSLLSVSDDHALYTNDLWSIKDFTVPADAKVYSDLKHLAFVENLRIENGVSNELHNIASLANLTKLYISGTAVDADILKSISALPLLEQLTLKDCNLSNISALENAVNMVALDLSDNTIRNIDALKMMNGLTELTLQGNTISDLSALSQLTKLTKLDISSNAVTSLAPLGALTGLTALDANINSISTLGDLSGLTALTNLDLEANKLTDISELAKCSALTDLNVASNALTQISSVSALKALMYFDFSYNQVTELPVFEKSCALVTIDGSHNKLSSLQKLSGLESLNNVHMDYNTDIASVEPLADCPVLIEVNVYATKVTDVTSLTNQSIIVNYNPVQDED